MSKFVAFAPLAALALAVGAASSASAALMFTGASGNLEATVSFDVSGSNLVVTLTNSSANDVLIPADVLTGVYFDITGSAVSLSRISAVVPGGSAVLFGAADPGNVVGGEWAYLGGLSGAPGGAKHGISSSGLGLFGPGDLFPGSNLAGPASPGGLEYGITSAGDNPATGNTPVTGANALIKNSVVFTLGGLPGGFDLGRIGNVRFQYGTSLTEPSFPGVPAPGAAAIAAIAGAAALKRRRRH